MIIKIFSLGFHSRKILNEKEFMNGIILLFPMPMLRLCIYFSAIICLFFNSLEKLIIYLINQKYLKIELIFSVSEPTHRHIREDWSTSSERNREQLYHPLTPA